MLRAADAESFPHLAHATAGSVMGPREGEFDAGLALID